TRCSTRSPSGWRRSASGPTTCSSASWRTASRTGTPASPAADRIPPIPESKIRSPAVKVLYIGGTGTISSACGAESVRQGQDVRVLNGGRTAGRRPVPAGVTTIEGDVQDAESMRRALDGTSFDCVVNFLSFGSKDASAAVELLAGRTNQYIH